MLADLVLSISGARTINMSQNFDRRSVLASLNLRTQRPHVEKDTFPMLVKGRKAPPSSPSHKGHKVAMFTRPGPP